MNKSKPRSRILKLRKKNSYKKLRLYPDRIFRFFKKNKINFKNVGGYYPCNHEIDDLDTLNFLRNKKANISLPIIREDNQMDFFEWTNKDPLKINKYGIAEPIAAKKIYPNIIFIPLVGALFILITRGSSKTVEKNSKYVAIFTSITNFLPGHCFSSIKSFSRSIPIKSTFGCVTFGGFMS